jgi:multiple sugar transport system ATP-binding protein
VATMTSHQPAAQPSSVRAIGGQSLAISLRDVQKRFDGFHAVRGLDLEIQNGELLVLLGPSGCGKTTTLNMLAGLEIPTSGQILFGDKVVNDLPPEERDIAMVFQSIALYPHLNVRENIGFALRTNKVPKAEVRQRTTEVAEILGLSSMLDRRITQLSGGQRQRVAIAKALVRRPALFLLDEPFSSLDAELRRQMRSELIRIHREVETTMVFVTHDQEEAMAIADRIVVMNEGQIVQLGNPLDLYQQPVNAWVARFIGSHPINILDATLAEGGQRIGLLPGGAWAAEMPQAIRAAMQDHAQGNRVLVGIRPEYLRIGQAGSGGPESVEGEVYTRQILGTDILYEIRVGEAMLRAVTPVSELYDLEQRVAVGIDWNNTFVFDAGTEERIYPPPVAR